MAKMTRKQLSKFDMDLGHAKNCERAMSVINELVRLSISLGDDDLDKKVLSSLDRCYNDIYEDIHCSLPIEENEK